MAIDAHVRAPLYTDPLNPLQALTSPGNAPAPKVLDGFAPSLLKDKIQEPIHLCQDDKTQGLSVVTGGETTALDSVPGPPLGEGKIER